MLATFIHDRLSASAHLATSRQTPAELWPRCLLSRLSTASWLVIATFLAVRPLLRPDRRCPQVT